MMIRRHLLAYKIEKVLAVSELCIQYNCSYAGAGTKYCVKEALEILEVFTRRPSLSTSFAWLNLGHSRFRSIVLSEKWEEGDTQPREIGGDL